MAGAAWTGGVIGQLVGGFCFPLSSLGLGLLLVCAGGLHPYLIGFKLCLKASPVACSSLVCVSNNLEPDSLSWRLDYRLFPECALWLHRGLAFVCPVQLLDCALWGPLFYKLCLGLTKSCALA